MFDMDNSESSAAEEQLISNEEKNVRIFAKQMLQGRLFLGHFQEKRRVDSVHNYRDVVVVNASETNLMRDMDVVRRRLKNYYKNIWVGITNPNTVGAPNGYCFWIESTNNTFGHYWYKIREIRFKRNEIVIRLKTVRAMTNKDTAVSEKTASSDIFLLVNKDNIINCVKEYGQWFITDILTAHNIKESLKFLSVMIAMLVTSCIYGAQYLLDFTLKFMREVSILMKVLTPVLIECVNLVGKVIGGFYLLIAMMFRPNTGPPAFNRPQIGNRRSDYRPIGAPY